MIVFIEKKIISYVEMKPFVAAGLRTRHTINMTRQSQFIVLQTRVYIVPCHAIALM